MINRKIIIAITTIFATAAISFGQSPEPVKPAVKPAAETALSVVKDPTVAEILKKYVEAQGGREAVEKVKTRTFRGAVALSPMGISGTIESFAVPENKTVSFMKFDGVGDFAEGNDGTTGWSTDPINGLRVKSGEEFTRQKMAASFYREINLEKIYEKLEFVERAKVGDRDAYVVKGTPKGLTAETMYFDVETGHLIRFDAVMVAPEGRVPASTVYSDFRKVDGVVHAFKMRTKLPQYDVVIDIKEIVQNTSIDDKIFAKPTQ